MPSVIFVLAVALQTICILQQIFEKSKCMPNVYTCFVDLEKVYDWVPRARSFIAI